MMKKKNAFLVDIDGTLCDSKFPISFLNGEKDTANYQVYYRTLDIVKPIEKVIFDLYHNIKQFITDTNNEEDLTIVFLTGRTAQIDAVYSTLEFLNKELPYLMNTDRIFSDFYFRPLNYHIDALTYKTEKFEMLKNMYNFLHIYEDEPSNIQMFEAKKQEGCIVHWVTGEYNYALEAQNIFTPSEDTEIIDITKV